MNEPAVEMVLSMEAARIIGRSLALYLNKCEVLLESGGLDAEMVRIAKQEASNATKLLVTIVDFLKTLPPEVDNTPMKLELMPTKGGIN